MKRMAEKITGVIGIAGFILVAGFMLLFSAVVSSDDFREVMSEEADSELAEEGITEEELSGFIEQMETANYTLDIVLLIALAFAGAAALVLLKKSSVLSAFIFSGSAVIAVLLFWSMILPVLPALFYLISGIIIFLRMRLQTSA